MKKKEQPTPQPLYNLQHLPPSAVGINPDNPRTIRETEFDKLVKSLLEFPEMLYVRGIAVADGVILGGNMRLKAIEKIRKLSEDEKIEIIEQQGERRIARGHNKKQLETFKTAIKFLLFDNTLPVLDVSEWPEDMRDEFIIKDNTDFGQWDTDVLANNNRWNELPLNDWGYQGDTGTFGEIGDGEGGGTGENPYTKKIIAPTYEPKNEKPNIEDLYDDSKTRELIRLINEADITEDERFFLVQAASRHIVFNYEKIADFYAHSDKTVQGLMEDSALVIIDFNKAIENGYVLMSKNITDQYLSDYDEEQ